MYASLRLALTESGVGMHALASAPCCRSGLITMHALRGPLPVERARYNR